MDHASILRLRGVLLNSRHVCPVCGGETMRVKRPGVFRLLRVSYRLCRHCLRAWISLR